MVNYTIADVHRVERIRDIEKRIVAYRPCSPIELDKIKVVSISLSVRAITPMSSRLRRLPRYSHCILVLVQMRTSPDTHTSFPETNSLNCKPIPRSCITILPRSASCSAFRTL